MEEFQQSLDRYLEGIYQPDSPGAAVVVARSGQPVFRKGYGMANLELSVPIRPELIFRLGSITKQFSAVAILMLESRGLLSVNDTLVQHLPDYPTQGKPITIEHLLTHTSGIKSYTSMPEWLPLIRKDFTLGELIDLFKDQPMDFEPGTRWRYNNSGYILLGAIIERVSGTTYENFIQQEIFNPLAMFSSLYDNPHRLLKNRVAGYHMGADGLENAAYLSMTQPYAAGSLASSVDDLVRWNQALLEGRLLQREILEEAWKPYYLPDGTNTHYGYGWGISEYEGHRMVEHGGGINGFVTHALSLPEDGLFVAVLTNTEDPPESPGWVAFQAACMALGLPYQEPQAAQVEPDLLNSLIGVYQNSLDPQVEVCITLDENQPKWQRTGGKIMELVPLGGDRFGFKKSLTRILVERDSTGLVKGMRNISHFGPDEFFKLTDKPLPQARTVIELAPGTLQKYAGQYEIAPGINLVLRMDGEKLFAHLGGQEAIELFPESETLFFTKVVDAQIEFELDEAGRPAGLVLHQGGQNMPAQRAGA